MLFISNMVLQNGFYGAFLWLFWGVFAWYEKGILGCRDHRLPKVTGQKADTIIVHLYIHYLLYIYSLFILHFISWQEIKK